MQRKRLKKGGEKFEICGCEKSKIEIKSRDVMQAHYVIVNAKSIKYLNISW